MPTTIVSNGFVMLIILKKKMTNNNTQIEWRTTWKSFMS